jgi:acetylornithine/N-succinyldiaminopimelate aminotransferase
MGRTGKFFTHEWAGITPDIVMSAKGIGGGFPLGAVLATENAASGMTAGTHGSTYGGNPLGCAVGCAVVEELTSPDLMQNVSARSGELRQGLEGLIAKHPDVFQEVRGTGLMLGLKCSVENLTVVKANYEAEMITVLAADNVIRLLPPLTITSQEVQEALARLDQAACSLS